MKKNGFTLIEILAVVVVLGLIGVIIIPKIVNTIDNSNDSSNRISISNLIDGLSGYALDRKALLVPFDGCSFDFEEDFSDCDDFEYKGKTPNRGILSVDSFGNVKGYVCFSDRCYSVSDNKKIKAITSSLYVFDYTGSEQVFTVPYTGVYKFELWGAQGGNGNGSDAYRGGYGSYSTGNFKLEENDVLYINVGGKGMNGSVNKVLGGYNGGGASTCLSDKNSGSGGGATHVALESGLLSTFSEKTNKLLIVAGGGGGGSIEYNYYMSTGGSGGGMTGVSGNFYNINGQVNTSRSSGGGGSQVSGGSGPSGSGSFGIGGESSNGAGGGGGFYGGGAGLNGSSGGGGSGYIGNSLLSDGSMYCYGCTESDVDKTLTISTIGNNELLDTSKCSLGFSDKPIGKCAKALNGYVKITYFGDF